MKDKENPVKENKITVYIWSDSDPGKLQELYTKTRNSTYWKVFPTKEACIKDMSYNWYAGSRYLYCVTFTPLKAGKMEVKWEENITVPAPKKKLTKKEKQAAIVKAAKIAAELPDLPTPELE
jgi:hypothetical protein